MARTCTQQHKYTHWTSVQIHREGGTEREKHTRIIHNIIIISLEKAINRTSWCLCLCNSCRFFSMVKHENYATRDQLYSPFFFFNYFEFNSIWVCVVCEAHSHTETEVRNENFEKEKNMNWIKTHKTVHNSSRRLRCSWFLKRTGAITKRNLWHALNGEIVWMTWAVNKRAYLNRIEFVLTCVCLGVITLGIMLCECTHWSYGVYYMILVIYEEKSICNHISKWM